MSKVQDDVVKVTITIEDAAVRSTSVFNNVLDPELRNTVRDDFDTGTKFRLTFKAFPDDAGLVEINTKADRTVTPKSTVADVIAKLQTFPQDAEVIVLDDATKNAIEFIDFDDEEPEKVLIW